ncbi:cilia- and flagella-associated protein 44 isoform X3 [Pygocentrus nattereri]|uniref:cilia- and flagella-associated protein 44 isoform X3 n=1 Tax=Pygocentrus nattereri TaxID=42514 RepID=UPI0008148105|nr:cilia- and flagella-associated protein 44 isoform X3 [Pygocentrus nattereri]
MSEEVASQDGPLEKQDALEEAGGGPVDLSSENHTVSTPEPGKQTEAEQSPASEIKDVEHAVSESIEANEGSSGEEKKEKQKSRIPEDLYYDYEELYSRPFTTEGSSIPQNLLQLSHSFGYDCRRRANLQLLDEHTLAFVAGNVLVLLDIRTKEQHYIRSCSGGGIGTIMPHPSRRYVAVAEKGEQPNIIIYEYPSLRPYRILRGGTGRAYTFVDFNRQGTLLASVGSAHDYMLTLWDWRQEQVMLRCKAFSQDIYRVTFSPDNPGQLTTSGSGHIKFWKMANTFTGLKLQGILGRFGKTALTDIEGYVELPDGKVVSGSEWGNMLLWDGGLIKVEICRKDGRTCHSGAIQQFALDEGELMTIGTDGAVRCWDFENIDTADSVDDSGLFEIEPMNELIIGRNVSLTSMVKSAIPDSTIWYAQDSNGGIWKLDLSFSNITQDPEHLFSFHAGAIEGMDVCGCSHLMATTALDRSVRIFDFLSRKELTTCRYKQGGTSLTWAPCMERSNEGLVVVGFDDGVVRLLELFNPHSLRAVAGRGRSGEAELRLKQAFKPHNAPVTAISYERNGTIMATGSVDCTVFFFVVGEQYEPIGFVTVPGPVQVLQWAPQSHERNTLLVACQTGHVVEIEAPGPDAQNDGSTYQLQNLPIRLFYFSSIKSRIKRDAEIGRRQAVKEKKKQEREERLRKMKEQGQEPTEEELHEEEDREEEEELPPLYIPNPPSPLHCAFYSHPGAFWLSMGGYDSGYLYHCKFAEQQSMDILEQRDEPFSFIPVQDTEHNPILTVCFSAERQLLLCGMQDGSIRAFLLEAGELPPGSMQAYWALSVHDNQHASIRQLRFSHDSNCVLSGGADGNIFSFKLLEQEELQKHQAKIPSPRIGLEAEPAAPDIEDPAAYSIETAKQKLELERMQKEAELRKQEKRKKLSELQSQFQKLLQQNQSLPEHVRLQRVELELDHRFREDAERVAAEKVREVRRELAWEEERHRLSLQKLQERFWNLLMCDIVTLTAIESDYKVSTYRLQVMSSKFQQMKEHDQTVQQPSTVEQERWHNKGEQKDPGNITGWSESKSVQEGLAEPVVLQPRVPQAGGSKLAGRQAEKLRKAAEKAKRVRAKIEKRKKEWAELYAAKPSEDCEDPEDVRAIQFATENMGDFKLKTAKDFTVPEHLRMNVEKKKAQLVILEEQIYQRKSEMNERVLALRDSKVALISLLRSLLSQLRTLQELLPVEKRRPLPSVPTLLPEETPERKLRYSRATLHRYATLRDKVGCPTQEKGQEQTQDVLELLQRENEEDIHTEEELTHSQENTHTQEQLTELELEMKHVEEIRSLYMQDTLIKQMEEAVWCFDAELRLLRGEKLRLDVQMKLADLRHVTLFQELLLLKEFEKRENTLQERLNTRMQEETELRLKLEECKQQLELKKRDIAKLQEREKALTATFLASLGENNKFTDFLTRVFKKKIKRVKKKEKTSTEEQQEDSDDDSDEESGWGDDEDDEESESGAGVLDDSVCPPNCDPELFENTVKLREHRLDVEELLLEEKKSADSLKKECDSLLKKEKIVQSSLKAAEGDLELFNREKQQKLNELDVVVPLRLHQIEYTNDDVVPSKLGMALVLNTAAVGHLQERIKELQQEKNQQRELYRHARQQHVQLSHERREMEAKILELEARCERMMMMKFGKLVDLEALQTLSGSRTLEEMRQESRVREAEYTQELKLWQDKVADARLAVTEVTREHTERLHRLNSLLTKQKQLEDKLNTRQRKMGAQFQGRRQVEEEERRRMQKLIQSQADEIESLRQEIGALSRKGGHILPPSQPSLPAIPTMPLAHMQHTHTRFSMGWRHSPSSSHEVE